MANCLVMVLWYDYQMLFLPCRFVGVNCRKEPVYVEPFLLLLRTYLYLFHHCPVTTSTPPPPFIVDSSLLSNKTNHEFFLIFFLFSLIKHDNWIFLHGLHLSWSFSDFSAQNYCCYLICSSYFMNLYMIKSKDIDYVIQTFYKVLQLVWTVEL